MPLRVAGSDTEASAQPPEPGTLAHLLQNVGRARVESLDEWLSTVTEILQSFFAVDLAAVGLLDSTSRVVMIAGLKTTVPTSLRPGIQLRASLTSIPELDVMDRPVVFGERAARPASRTLLEILRAENVRSWVDIPLHERGRVAGFLMFASSSDQTFVEDDSLLFDAVGQACETQVLQLAKDQTRELLSA